MSEAFNVAQFEAAETGLLEVLSQKEEPLIGADGINPVTIELYGPGSAQYARAQAKIDTANQARAFAAIRGKVTKDAAEENRKLTAEKFAAITKAVNNFPIAPLDLYMNPKLGYITNQVAKFADDWANFPSASSTT